MWTSSFSTFLLLSLMPSALRLTIGNVWFMIPCSRYSTFIQTYLDDIKQYVSQCKCDVLSPIVFQSQF